jgi:hypothetical protein
MFLSGGIGRPARASSMISFTRFRRVRRSGLGHREHLQINESGVRETRFNAMLAHRASVQTSGLAFASSPALREPDDHRRFRFVDQHGGGRPLMFFVPDSLPRRREAAPASTTVRRGAIECS